MNLASTHWLGTAVLILFSTVATLRAADESFVPTGVAEIDIMRRDFTAKPTTPENASRRHALIFSWVRLLVHRGVDMTDFHDACAAFSAWGPIDPSRYQAMKAAYEALEKIQSNPSFIEEVRGNREKPSSTQTDWPVFGGNLEQSGLSPDAGPRTGEVAWKFPVGMSWYASAAVEDGRVYIASPGVTTLAYCLDEKTGKVIWTTAQDGLQIYSTPRASSTPVMQKNHIVIRATSGSWEFEEKAKHVFRIDKKTGKVASQLDADRVDYRRGIAPIRGNNDYLVYPYGRLDLRGMPAFYEMQDTVVVRKADGSPWWTMRAGDLFGEPILSGDHVFAAADDGILHAFHLTGPQRVAWTYDAGSPLRSTPVADGNAVYVGAQDGTLHALNISDGSLRWKLKLNEGEPRAQQLFSPPALHDGKLYLGSATREIYCLDTKSGALAWKAATSDWIRSRPLVVANGVYAAGLDGKVTAFDLQGNQRWSAAAGHHPVFADLSGSENGILASSSELFLYSLDPATGKQQWKHSLLQCIYEDGRRILADVVAAGGDYQSPPTVSNGKVFVGGPDRFVRAMDTQSGKEIWRFETSGQVSGAPTVHDGRVFFGQQGGNDDLHCVSEADGAPLWTAQPGWVWTTSTPHGGRLYTGTVDGKIFALSTEDGSTLWMRPTNGGIYPSPAVSKGLVYTGSWDGYYYALDEKTGRTHWAYAKEGVDYSRGGGPDSAAAILWKDKLLGRIVPNTLVALDQQTGLEKWRFNDPTRLKKGMNATASASGDKVFISTTIDHDGMPCGARLFCLDDKTGQILWHYTGAGGWTGSVCTPDTVICGSSTDVFISCLATEPNPDGKPKLLWRTRVGSIFQESIPAIHGDRAFILCSDGYLYAFQ
jgi:outer membrane protein assembly factor BamB